MREAYPPKCQCQPAWAMQHGARIVAWCSFVVAFHCLFHLSTCMAGNFLPLSSVKTSATPPSSLTTTALVQSIQSPTLSFTHPIATQASLQVLLSHLQPSYFRYQSLFPRDNSSDLHHTCSHQLSTIQLFPRIYCDS